MTQTEILAYARNNQPLMARNKLLDRAYDLDRIDYTEKVNQWCRKLFDNQQKLNDNLLQELRTLLTDLPESATSPAQEKQVISLKSISKTYSSGSFTLSNVSLEIREGEIIGIVGENGNGKTTLLNIVAQNIDHNAGDITYHFLRRENAGRYFIRQHIGFIPQRIPRWHGSLKASMHFAASCYGIYGKENEVKVEQILHRLDLWKFNAYNWNSISSGYKTRFEIARVLLGRPKLLVLDEPLSNLDINTQQILLSDLRNIAKSPRHRMGILMSSQQLHEIENASDNIIFLKQGKCIFQSATDKESLHGTMVEVSVSGQINEKLERIKSKGYTVKTTGTFYVLMHEEKNRKNEILKLLLDQEIEIHYFRDISGSAKRFFNQDL